MKLSDHTTPIHEIVKAVHYTKSVNNVSTNYTKVSERCSDLECSFRVE